MRKLVLASCLVAGVLSLEAAGRVEAQEGRFLPRTTPFSSIRSAALGFHGYAATLQSRGAAAASLISRLTVAVPHVDAELLLNGEPTGGTGLSREVASPPRQAGSVESYTLTARWRPNNYTVLTRRVSVRVAAGGTAAVDLTMDSPGDTAQIRYVATSAYVVAEMIDLAGVRTDDVVFEPGCGDARLTIAAVKAGAKRGVGIDLDAERVAESKAKVKAAGLESRVEIRLGDALAIPDLSEASLVFLYMGDEFNHLIRPILRKRLRIGARVVSHRFTMGDWTPDKTISLPDEAGNIDLHLWTITAAVKEAGR